MKHNQDTIPTVFHYDGGSDANNSMHMGTVGVRDVYVIDANNVGLFGDNLFNWTAREDVILITNYGGKLKDISLTDPQSYSIPTYIALDALAPQHDIVVWNLTMKEVKSMIVFGDTFDLI